MASSKPQACIVSPTKCRAFAAAAWSGGSSSDVTSPNATDRIRPGTASTQSSGRVRADADYDRTHGHPRAAGRLAGASSPSVSRAGCSRASSPAPRSHSSTASAITRSCSTGVLIAPLIAAVGASTLEVGLVGLYAVALALLLGEVNDIFFTSDHVVRVGVVAAAGIAAIGTHPGARATRAGARDRTPPGDGRDAAPARPRRGPDGHVELGPHDRRGPLGRAARGALRARAGNLRRLDGRCTARSSIPTTASGPSRR